MTQHLPWAARLATWWVGRYTGTAPAEVGAERRAEMRSDVHDHLAHARANGVGTRTASVSVLGRALRGVVADIAWRLQVERVPGRREWHVANPSTVLGVLFTVLVPVTLVLDGARGPAPGLAVVEGLLALPSMLLGALALSFALVAAVRHLRTWPLRPHSRGFGAVRRAALCWMCALWAAAALWRFLDDPLARLASAAWLGFGIALLVYGVGVIGSVVGRILDLRKVSS